MIDVLRFSFDVESSARSMIKPALNITSLISSVVTDVPVNRGVSLRVSKISFEKPSLSCLLKALPNTPLPCNHFSVSLNTKYSLMFAWYSDGADPSVLYASTIDSVSASIRTCVMLTPRTELTDEAVASKGSCDSPNNDDR